MEDVKPHSPAWREQPTRDFHRFLYHSHHFKPPQSFPFRSVVAMDWCIDPGCFHRPRHNRVAHMHPAFPDTLYDDQGGNPTLGYGMDATDCLVGKNAHGKQPQTAMDLAKSQLWPSGSNPDNHIPPSSHSGPSPAPYQVSQNSLSRYDNSPSAVLLNGFDLPHNVEPARCPFFDDHDTSRGEPTSPASADANSNGPVTPTDIEPHHLLAPQLVPRSVQMHDLHKSPHADWTGRSTFGAPQLFQEPPPLGLDIDTTDRFGTWPHGLPIYHSPLPMSAAFDAQPRDRPVEFVSHAAVTPRLVSVGFSSSSTESLASTRRLFKLEDNVNGPTRPFQHPTHHRRGEIKEERGAEYDTDGPRGSITTGGAQELDESHWNSRDEFLLQCRRLGMPYREIKRRGHFSEAVSTLRGRVRFLTKDPAVRVRRPAWDDNDVALLRDAVETVAPSASRGAKSKFRWKEISEYMLARGSSYPFAAGTCARKWKSLQ